MKNFLRHLIVLTFFSCLHLHTWAQNAPVFSQFTLNPFQFNPSFAAQQGHFEVNLFYRKQWMGIENAPEAGAINFQAPVGRNVALGVMVLTNKTILLNTNSALATFAYRVRLAYHHHINFGISGGIAMNNFDLEAVANANDPALNNLVQKSQYFTGQFGFNYQFKNLNIGFALPNLFDSKANSLNEFQDIEFNPFDNKFASAFYDFNLGNVQLSPTVLYRAIEQQQDQWEVMLMATYKKFLWVGASYRDGYGLTGIIGVRIKDNYRASYAYEYPTSSLSKASSGSHEIYLGARLGKRDREAEVAMEKKSKDSVQQVATPKKEPAEKEPAEKAVEKTEVAQVQPVIAAPIVVPVVVAEKKPEEPEKPTEVDEPADYYIVLGSYRSQQNALTQMQQLREKNLSPQMLHETEKNYYYVYLIKTGDKNVALEELAKERELNRYTDVWMYKVPIKKK